MKTLNVIGGGRVGKVIGYLAQRAGYQVQAVFCQRLASAQLAADFIGGGRAYDQLDKLPSADLNLISVPDRAIASVAAQLASERCWQSGQLVFHASGAGEAALLAPLAARGVLCASLHPAFSFADPARAVQDFAGTRCALEGDERAFAELQSLVAAIGGQAFALAPGGKPAYHAALAVASNYLVTLHELARQLALSAGMAPGQMEAVLGDLMQKTLANSLALGPHAALTGPIVRGDAETIARHRAVMSAPQDELYCALGRATLVLAAAKLDRSQQVAVSAALQQAE